MTDQELLSLAARAAGYKVSIQTSDGAYVGHTMGRAFWNPLTDDGDALRLAVKLCLHINYGFGFDGPKVFADDISELMGEEHCAAVRKAIVRAAAEIGKQP